MKLFLKKITYRQTLPLLFVALFLLLIPKDTAYASIGSAILDHIGGAFYQVCLFFGGIFVVLGGVILDGSFKLLVLGMGDLFVGSAGLGTVVSQLWTIIRDFLNMLFIFGLIYIGIKTILNSEDSGTRRSLGLLIAAALLINFSLLITQTIVDFTNIIAVEVYNQTLHTDIATQEGQSTNAVDIEGEDSFFLPGRNTISGSFIHTARLTTWANGASIEGAGASTFVLGIMMFVFFVFTGIIMAFGGFLLIGRFIALMIYMIFSPVMFLGWILPNFSNITKKWWNGFFKQCFFAPIYLFLLFISLRVMQTLMNTIRGGTSYADLTNVNASNTDTISVFVYFCMMIGLLYASIKVGQMMSIAGASGMSGAIEGAGKSIRGGISGAAYRGTVGWGMNKFGVGMYDSLDKTVENNQGARRMSLGGLKRGTAKVARGLAGGETGRKAVVKARDYGAGGGLGRADAEKQEKERTVRTQRNVQLTNLRSEINNGNEKSHGDTERISMEKAVRDATGDQVVEMMKSPKDRSLITSVAGDLSDTQFKAVMADKELDDGVKVNLAKARGDQVAVRLQKTNLKPDGSTPEIAEVIGKAETSDLQALGFQKALDNADWLTDKQLGDWKDLTPTEKSQIKSERKKKLGDLFDTKGAAEVFNRFKNDTERAKLPDKILKDEKSVPHLNTKVLGKIIDNDGISEDDRKIIKENIRKYYGTNPATMDRAKFDQNEKWFNTPLGQTF